MNSDAPARIARCSEATRTWTCNLHVAEIAGILKLNPRTVRNWIDAGTLPVRALARASVRAVNAGGGAFLATARRDNVGR